MQKSPKADLFSKVITEYVSTTDYGDVLEDVYKRYRPNSDYEIAY